MLIPPILAATQNQGLQQIWKFFVDGGFCMILLGICSFVAVAAMLFKLMSLRPKFIVPPGLAGKLAAVRPSESSGMESVLSEIEQGRSTLARLCGVALRHRGETRSEITEAVQSAAREEILHLHAGMSVIDATISLAPLLGLLGMASGLVGMFGGLGENPDPSRVSHGISEALNTTVFGLGLAVPAIIAHAYFLRRIEVFVARLEALLAHVAHCIEGSNKTVRPLPPVISHSK